MHVLQHRHPEMTTGHSPGSREAGTCRRRRQTQRQQQMPPPSWAREWDSQRSATAGTCKRRQQTQRQQQMASAILGTEALCNGRQP